MTRGTTPTITVTVPDSIDFLLASSIYATIEQGAYKLLKTDEVLYFTQNSVTFHMTQAETLRLTAGTDVKIQLNWTYSEGRRGCTEILRLPVEDNLEGRVLE